MADFYVWVGQSYTQYDLVRKPSTLDALIGFFTPSHVIHQRLLLQFLSAPEDGCKASETCRALLQLLINILPSCITLVLYIYYVMADIRTETLIFKLSNTHVHQYVCGGVLEGNKSCRLSVELRKNTCSQTCMVDVRTRNLPNLSTCFLVDANSIFPMLQFWSHCLQALLLVISFFGSVQCERPD